MGFWFFPCSVLLKLAALEVACSRLFDSMIEGNELSSLKDATWEDSFALTQLADMMLLSASNLRRIIQRVPSGISASQPGATRDAEDYFSGRKEIWWHGTTDTAVSSSNFSDVTSKQEEEGVVGAERTTEGTFEQIHNGDIENGLSAKATSGDNDNLYLPIPAGVVDSDHEKKFVELNLRKRQELAAEASVALHAASASVLQDPNRRHKAVEIEIQRVAPQGSKFALWFLHIAHRTGVKRWHMVLALQTAIVFLIGALFCVFDATYKVKNRCGF